jgi:dTDP-4-amino-4,6-dideoxygalactose transaminase
MLRELTRAGMKITMNDFKQGLKSVVCNGNDGFDFEDKFKDYLGLEYAFGVSSGSVALYLILKALRVRSDKDEVIIPAFICPTVPLAIARAGLRIKVCDNSRDNFNFDYQQLRETINDKTLCVIAAHLAGFPCDLDKLLKITENKNTLLIEDCAQAMGAEYRGRKVGRFGSVAFFSLGRGKGLTTYRGGLIATGDENCAGMFDSGMSDLTPNILANFLNILELAGYMVFLHPRLFFYIKRFSHFYWRSRNLPLQGENEYHRMYFDVAKLSNFQKGVGCSLLMKFDNVVKEQRRKGKYLTDCLEGIDGLRALKEVNGGKSTYLLLPVILEDSKKCEEVFKALKRERVGVSNLYTRSINQYEYLREIVPDGSFPNAEGLAKRTLTLPTHAYVTQSDMNKMVDIIKGII